MNAMHARLAFAAALLLLPGAITNARAAKPEPVYADVVISFAGQSSGFIGPLRHFEMTEAGGRVALDLESLQWLPDVPLSAIAVADLSAPGNAWQVQAFLNRSPVTFTGACAVESFRSVDAGVPVLHVYLNCVDLET